MGSMDVVLPSFTDLGNCKFGSLRTKWREIKTRRLAHLSLFLASNLSDYDRQASSTVAMAMQCEVPLLVTPRILRAYSYLSSSLSVPPFFPSPTTSSLPFFLLPPISPLPNIYSLLTLSRSLTGTETTILRPQTLTEIQALHILRTSLFSPPARGYLHTAERSYTEHGDVIGVVSSGDEMEEHVLVRREAEEMVKRGWTTTEKAWRKFKKGVREGNEVVVRKMVLQR